MVEWMLTIRLISQMVKDIFASQTVETQRFYRRERIRTYVTKKNEYMLPTNSAVVNKHKFASQTCETVALGDARVLKRT